MTKQANGMRPIKFRIPHFDNITKKFVRFSYWGAIDHKGNIVLDHSCFQSPGQNNSTFPGWHEQFTGLTDKAGKEIYEGDIVRKDSYSEGYYQAIMWKERGCCFCVGDTGFSPLYDGTDYTVSGNIHEHPNLLK